MAHFSTLFNRIPVQVQNRSGFDMSHSRYFTATTGTLTPCLCAEILPADRISLGVFAAVNLPPMASNFVGRIDAHIEYFFVPNRIVYGGWQRVMTQNQADDPSVIDSTPTVVPSLDVSNYEAYMSEVYEEDYKTYSTLLSKAGGLADYLGLRLSQSVLHSTTENFKLNLLPFLAYHKIWDDWYRDSRIQKPCFPTFDGSSDDDTLDLYNLPFKRLVNTVDLTPSTPEYLGFDLFNGVNLFYLHQRNWMKDYFTNASRYPQSNSPAKVMFDTSGSTGSFSIAALRAANSLQLFMERNNIAGFKYGDQIYAQYGVTPSDAVFQKAVYLGRQVIPVYNTAVVQTSNAQAGTGTASQFSSVGTEYGRSQALGDGSIVDSFEAKEHGYLIGIFSLVPHAVYSSGTARHFSRYGVESYPFPILAGVGDQDIWMSEVTSATSPQHWNTTFGYTQRFSEMKYIDDTVHGLLRDGENLAYMVMQRSFAVPQTVNSRFIEIPTNYLDQCFAVSEEVSGFSCWVNLYQSLRMSRALPAYSIPSLEAPKDTHTQVLDLGGKRL